MRQDALKYSFFVLLLCLGFVAALGTGVINIPLSDTAAILIHRMTGMLTNPLTQGILGDVIWQLRMPRFFAACLAGAGLAVCGVVVQAVVRNPLADPYILGISSGAGLGATAAVALRLSRVLGQDSMGLFAFLGALLASLLILLLASHSRQRDSFHLLLVGLALNVICSAGISLFVALAADEAGIQTITYWLMGSLLQVQWHGLLILTVVVLLGVVFFCTQQKILDLLLLDDDTVLTMGLRADFQCTFRRTLPLLGRCAGAHIVAWHGCADRHHGGALRRTGVSRTALQPQVWLWEVRDEKTIFENQHVSVGFLYDFF